MATVIYDGGYPAVDIPEAGIVGAERGTPIEVSDEVAAKLLEQADYREPKTKKEQNATPVVPAASDAPAKETDAK